MRHLVHRLTIIAIGSAALTTGVLAQDLRYLRRTAGFGAIGAGGGNFTVDCDSACLGDQESSTGANLVLGRHLSQRVRLELGLQYQSNRDLGSNVFSAGFGAAVYLVGNLHVRGAATYQKVDAPDSTGTTTGSGGPGFLVGAGYDLYLGRIFALTPYVNYTAASLSSLERTPNGGSPVSTSGNLTALNFGVSASWIRGEWECTFASGEKVRVRASNRSRALACLAEVERRIGRRPSGIKY